MTIPNMLSCFRIALIPAFIWQYINVPDDQIALWPILILILSGITDILDGFIARRFNMISDLGKMLDPVADKMTQAAVIGCLMFRFPELMILFVVYVIKELVMMIGGLVMLKGKKKRVPYAKWYGKISTFEMYFAMALLLVFPAIGKHPVGIWTIIAVSMFLVIFALAKYLMDYLKTPASEGESK